MSGDQLSVRRAIGFFIDNLARQTERQETIGVRDMQGQPCTVHADNSGNGHILICAHVSDTCVPACVCLCRLLVKTCSLSLWISPSDSLRPSHLY